MLNQVIIVGRITHQPMLETLGDGSKRSLLNLAVKRPYKDPETNEYEEDNLICALWSGVAENVVKHCRVGATVGIKARLQEATAKLADGKTLKYSETIAEKITFINSKGE